MRRGSRGSRGRYGTCAAAALMDLRETGASRGGGRAAAAANEVVSYGIDGGGISGSIFIQGGWALGSGSGRGLPVELTRLRSNNIKIFYIGLK